MAKVFISYDREDSDFAELVDSRLAKAGHSACLDVEILNAGETWRDKLDQAIRGAEVMVVIMTPDARDSDYVAYEWAFALGAGVRVIPLELKATSIHPRLDVLQRLDFTHRQRPWETLLQEVEKSAQAQQSTTVPVPAGTPPTIKKAVAALDSLDIGEQVAGIRSLVHTDHPAARDALAAAMRHPVASVRMAAAVEMPDRDDPGIIPGLIDILQDHYFLQQHYPGLNYHVAAHVARFGAAATPHLLEALQDRDPHVRTIGASVLGRMREKNAVADLTDALKDGSPLVRESAAKALGRIGEKDVGPDLVQALGDEADSVRTAAAMALGDIGHHAAVSDLRAMLSDECDPVRAASAEALGKLQARPAVPDLLRRMHKDNRKVRAASALALGRIGDPAVFSDLVQAFQDGADDNSTTSQAAAQALGLLGDQRAIDPLLAFLTDRQQSAVSNFNSLCFTVAEALLKLKSADSIAIIADMLGRYGGNPPVGIVELLSSSGQRAVPILIELLNHHKISNQKRYATILKKIGGQEALAAVEQWNRSQ